MKPQTPNLANMICGFLEQGLSVVYIDQDVDRRRQVQHEAENWPDDLLQVMPGTCMGGAMEHCNVVIAVNERDFDPRFAKEWRCIAGVCNNTHPIAIHVDI